MNRCLNNFFAYCNGTPDTIGPPHIVNINHPGTDRVAYSYTTRTCPLTYKTCDNLVEQSQLSTTNEPSTIQLSLHSCPLGREAGK